MLHASLIIMDLCVVGSMWGGLVLIFKVKYSTNLIRFFKVSYFNIIMVI